MSASVTLPAAVAMLLAEEPASPEEAVLDRSRELDRFLSSVERRAFKIAQIAIRDIDEALDIVQDAMLQLARRYAARPSEEWKPLFYRILNNRIRDCQRRRVVRSRFIAWWPARLADDEEAADPIESAAGTEMAPGDRVQVDETLQALERALADLPRRQQQAFLLRTLEGLDVAGTAAAMGCSEGSVKTHYFRALQTLRARLGEFWS
ncbi:MAG TPA: RNA polymerase sigma factor [Steroidobacteraceae bacterium]|jgi:RNA polymerase sigma-70 factor, ECF subfamily|nr:RNA polymerase sigma factor [Steroidobacteraceae bacterium]